MDDHSVIKQRRERLIWAIIAIIFVFVLLNSMGIISTGHFEREPTPTPMALTHSIPNWIAYEPYTHSSRALTEWSPEAT